MPTNNNPPDSPNNSFTPTDKNPTPSPDLSPYSDVLSDLKGGGGGTLKIDPETDEKHMRRALQLAAQTTAQTSPNPQVGCVLTRNNEIIGEGAHYYALYDHAEIAALKQAASLGHKTQGATAYVTLEPCSHHGRTGPCADALIAAGITRCVIATQDPNPQVSGRGIARLRAAGITVELALLQQPARDLNDPFARSIRTGRPLVTLKAALSVDGKLAPPPASRTANQPHWLTGPAARADVQLLRHASDAILTGIGTVLADNPNLSDRTALPRRRPLLRVILDTNLRTPLSSQLLLTAANDLLILHAPTASSAKAEALQAAGAELQPLPAHNGRLSLPAVLTLLAERHCTSLLLEAGSHINGAFLQQDLVDKAVLFYSETELGPAALPFATGIASPYQFEHSLRRIERLTFPHGSTQDARITGYLHDPWQALPPIS
jgi:diaminohydroxyphosphoribosylaminopyrimidine deaminase/5-amino-6-(5-phosphoribosylamino)uracil reductase